MLAGMCKNPHVNTDGHAVAELDISPDLWFFDCHFPGDPVMPGCLGLDAMWQMIGYWLGWSGSPGKGRAIGVGEVEATGSITPNTRCVRYEVAMRMVRRGIIKGRQLCRGAPWVIKVEDMAAYREQKPSRRSLTSDPTQQSFMFQ